MPIKGLSDARRLPRAGKLKLGYKDPDRGFPRRSEWFIAAFDDPEIEAEFERLYGDKPTRVPVAFFSTDQNEVFEQWYKCYGSGSGLKCKGDGEVAGRVDPNNPEQFIEVPCNSPDDCDFSLSNGSHGKPGCSLSATLSFFVKDLPVMQVVQVTTSAKNSLFNINSGLFLLGQLCERSGKNPLSQWVVLILRPQDSIVAGKKTKIYVLDLVIPGSLGDFAALDAPATETPRLPEPAQEAPAPAPAPEVSPTAGGFSPQVESAMKAAGTGDVKRAALAKSGWSDEELLRAIGAPAPSTPEPTPEPTAPEQEGLEF